MATHSGVKLSQNMANRKGGMSGVRFESYWHIAYTVHLLTFYTEEITQSNQNALLF